LDDNKKPGARDLNDLKARLGLKQTNTMAAVSPTGAPVPAQPMVTPPSTHPAAPIAPPFVGPQSQPPVDLRPDPFVAQTQAQAANLAAFYGVGQQLPGSTEGISDAPISKPKPWGQILGFVGVAAVTFGAGNACGRIYSARVEFNQTTDHARSIREEVENLSKNLNNIANSLKKSGQIEVAAALGALDLKKPETTKIFHTNYAQLDGLVVDRLFTYYNDTIKLYDEIAVHAKRTNTDRELIANYLKNGASKLEKNYGVTFDLSSAFPIVNFVELGGPICPGGKPDCSPNELKGFKYRTEVGGTWSERPIKGKPGETVTPLNKKGAMFASLVSGGTDVLAVEAANKRLSGIIELIGKIANTQKELLSDLKKVSDRPKVFTL
jgi:hypothetical protein